MANIITVVRIICSIGLLFIPVFSPAFYVLYLIAGVSDMVDGTIARKLYESKGFRATGNEDEDEIELAVTV